MPEHRELREQANDLRLDLRNARLVLGQFERVLHGRRAAETLAEALDDRHRLGRVSVYMVLHFHIVGRYDRALASGQRALTLAAASGDSGTHIGVVRHAAISQGLPAGFPRRVAAVAVQRRWGTGTPSGML